jgi:hypothetical protein
VKKSPLVIDRSAGQNEYIPFNLGCGNFYFSFDYMAIQDNRKKASERGGAGALLSNDHLKPISLHRQGGCLDT